jgi:hypothetical protein
MGIFRQNRKDRLKNDDLAVVKSGETAVVLNRG